MSSPVPISCVEPGTSTTPCASGGILGSSPRTHQAPATAARKFYKRLLYDATVDASQFSVGLLETREQAERRSGVEAWSLRLHSHLTELSFNDFTARFEGQDIPFHRVAFFKQNGAVVWESENLLRKAGDLHHQNAPYGSSSHHSARSELPPVPVLSACQAGFSPPAGSFMARIAAATPGAPTGLPPRVSSSQVPDYSSSSSFTAGCSSSKPHRYSATDYGSSPHSWSATAQWSAVASGGSLSGTPYGRSPLGCSPASSAACNSTLALYGTSPKLAGSWAGSVTLPGGPSRGNSCTISPSPGGSCSSSWTGTSPLAAAVAAGMVSLSHPKAVITGDAASTAVEQHLQEQLALLQQLQDGEEPVLADYSQLPEECWLLVLQQLGVKELCIMSRINRALKALAARSFLWSAAYERLFGTAPPSEWSEPTIKRLCRRSELRASRWLDADVEGHAAGFTGTCCCQLDDTKVVSGDGSAVRLWSHDTGRRIATLRGHTGRVTSVAFDDEFIISGCSQATVKLWSMDELKLSKTLRHHTGPISATVLLNGLPISGSKDGSVCVWDAAAPNTPLVVLEVGAPVQALELQEEKGHLLCASSSLGVYDLNTTQLLYNLTAPAGSSRFSSSSGSSSSSDLAPAAPLGVAVAHAESVGSTAVAAGVAGDALDDGLDADAYDGVLLQDDWFGDDSDSSSDDGDDDPALAAAAGGQGAAAHSSSDGKPFTSVSCYGNLVAAGRAGSVVLWDLRSQDAVGMLTPSSHDIHNGSNSPGIHSAPCVGVQLDDWKLVTGWTAGDAGGGASSSSGCWWRSSADVAGAADSWGATGHSLQLYDIRAAASFSSCETGSSSGGGSRAPWAAEAVMTLPVPNRITCFQFHKQNLLVGQEGADCCLVTFNPPGTNIATTAAAWGYAGSGSGSSRAAMGPGCYGVSPGANGNDDGVLNEGPGGRGKGKKKGGAKVPAKKQTRYPKRTTR